MTPRRTVTPREVSSSRGVFLAPRVAVVVPARNEQRRIARVVETMPARVIEIVLVDDASEDATADAARAVGDPRLVVVRHARRRGVGAAIESGYREAFARGAEVVVVMAGDAQMDPSDLEALLAPVASGEAGYAKGNRLDHAGARGDMPRLRRLGGEVLSRLTSVAVGRSVRDSQCGYTAINRRSWERVSRRPLWPSYGYPNDLLVRLSRAGVSVRDVPVRAVYVGKRGGMGLRHALLVVPYVILWSLSSAERA